MAHITLSIPDKLYEIMKKYKEINWSEIARRAIIKELLLLKAGKEGLTREELNMLLELLGIEFTPREYPYDVEIEMLKKIRERERKRINFLKKVEEQ